MSQKGFLLFAETDVEFPKKGRGARPSEGRAAIAVSTIA